LVTNQIEARSALRFSVPFALADALFLMIVGSASNSAMHLVHALEWNFGITLLLGMAAAMGVQMSLAVLAAPVLGSIETMVPSMIVGMLSPMQLCAIEFFGYHVAPRRGILAGAAFGLATFIVLWCWGQCRRRSYQRTFPEK
jgi:hypothetical protein